MIDTEGMGAAPGARADPHRRNANLPSMDFGVVLVAAGEGRRFGRPKALLELAGRTLLERAAAPFAAFEPKVVVLRPIDRGACRLDGWIQVHGGARRRDSVAAGLAALGPKTHRVLIHDMARPLLTEALVQRVVAAARTETAVVPALPVADTIKEVSADLVLRTLDRSALVAVQTPQAFDLELLRRALAMSDEEVTDEAALLEAQGQRIRIVAGEAENFKITTPSDLRLAEAVWAARASG